MPMSRESERNYTGAGGVENTPDDLPADVIATDSEWDTSLEEPWLCTTFANSRAAVFCVRADLPRAVWPRLEGAVRDLGVKLLFGRRTDRVNLLKEALPYLVEDPDVLDRVRLANFFSP